MHSISADTVRLTHCLAPDQIAALQLDVGSDLDRVEQAQRISFRKSSVQQPPFIGVDLSGALSEAWATPLTLNEVKHQSSIGREHVKAAPR